MNNMKCSICGKNIKASAYTNKDLEGNILPPMCEDAKCWDTYFWERQLKIDEREECKNRTVIVDGIHYFIGDQIPKGKSVRFAGHGGRIFHIKFNDGREVTTNNLWCQGDISDEFKDKFPDNAKFL